MLPDSPVPWSLDSAGRRRLRVSGSLSSATTCRDRRRPTGGRGTCARWARARRPDEKRVSGPAGGGIMDAVGVGLRNPRAHSNVSTPGGSAAGRVGSTRVTPLTVHRRYIQRGGHGAAVAAERRHGARPRPPASGQPRRAPPRSHRATPGSPQAAGPASTARSRPSYRPDVERLALQERQQDTCTRAAPHVDLDPKAEAEEARRASLPPPASNWLPECWPAPRGSLGPVQPGRLPPPLHGTGISSASPSRNAARAPAPHPEYSRSSSPRPPRSSGRPGPERAVCLGVVGVGASSTAWATPVGRS